MEQFLQMGRSRTARGHNRKLSGRSVVKDVRKYSYSIIAVDEWNKLSKA